MLTQTPNGSKRAAPKGLFDIFGDRFADEMQAELNAMRRTMSQLVDSAMRFGATSASALPQLSIDLYEKDGGYVVEAALPGVKKENVEVEVAGDTLTIRAKQEEKKEEKDARYHYRELQRGEMVRAVTLPQAIDPGSVKASFKDGVLNVAFKPVKGMETKKISIGG
ncbi:MAG TPA: Hsp20/alpha crystallin family protein [Candidatus Dormibacteraeota bacterium]|nr:Hsp20/alpha crystallin family protein [Candidatus Dormibacteraeota bacterium]